MLIYNNRIKNIDLKYNCNNLYFLDLEICKIINNTNYILKFDNINVNINLALTLINKNNIITVIETTKKNIVMKIQVMKYLENYYNHREILNKNVPNYKISKEDIQKNIFIKVNILNWILYVLFDDLDNIKIPIIIKKEEYLKKKIKYKVFMNYINDISDIIKDQFDIEKYDEFIAIKIRLKDNKYMDVIIFYTKLYISFYYKKEYNDDCSSICNEVCNILSINEKKIIEKDISTIFIVEEEMDIKILYFLFKNDEILSKLFTMKEIISISLLKGIIYTNMKLYILEFDFCIKIKQNRIEINVTNIKYKYYLDCIEKIILNIIKIYENYNKSKIDKFIKIVEKNNFSKNNKSQINLLRIINSKLFVSGYKKHASIKLKYIKENDIIGNKQNMIENNKLLCLKSEWYIADDIIT